MTVQTALTHFENLQVDDLITPCLLVCPEIVERNLRSMIAIAGSAERLRPHVKTHKCPQIVQLAVRLGVRKHKCATLAEAEMLAEHAPDILVAYPQVGPAVSRFVDLVSRYPHRKFSTVVDAIQPAQALSDQAQLRGAVVDVLIEVDPGMHRTGIKLGQPLIELARQLIKLPGIRLSGLHLYDGHHHQADLVQRTTAVESMMGEVLKLVRLMQQENLPVDQLVCGGTPTFPVLAKWFAGEAPKRLPLLELSPGTCVLSDYNYGRDYPDVSGICSAAILLTRVISKPAADLVTVDLGYKAISADPPAGRRCHFLDIPDAQEVRHNEEHLVVRTAQAAQLQIGQVLRVLPAHICPTVALHDRMFTVDQGSITAQWPILRHRLYG